MPLIVAGIAEIVGGSLFYLRLTRRIRRLEMVQDVTGRKLTLAAAAARNNVSVPTVRKWVGLVGVFLWILIRLSP